LVYNLHQKNIVVVVALRKIVYEVLYMLIVLLSKVGGNSSSSNCIQRINLHFNKTCGGTEALCSLEDRAVLDKI